nr:hypothetical protein GCM10020093_008560 [Planobispora longispora]
MAEHEQHDDGQHRTQRRVLEREPEHFPDRDRVRRRQRGITAATARNTSALRPAQMRKVVRQSLRLSRAVPSGMPTTAAIEMPDITTAAALLAWRCGTRRIAMLTPMAQNTPLANPMASRVVSTSG